MLCHVFLTSLPATCSSSLRTHAVVEAVIFHISNESELIRCIPETAVMQCSAPARDQPPKNVYHWLPGLFNESASGVDVTASVPVFYDIYCFLQRLTIPQILEQ